MAFLHADFDRFLVVFEVPGIPRGGQRRSLGGLGEALGAKPQKRRSCHTKRHEKSPHLGVFLEAFSAPGGPRDLRGRFCSGSFPRERFMVRFGLLSGPILGRLGLQKQCFRVGGVAKTVFSVKIELYRF